MEFKQVIGDRSTIRFFDPDKPVEPEKIQIMLEAANRIPSARIPMVINEASGVCLYHELAKLEASDTYQAPKAKEGYAGFITTVAKRGPVKLDGFKEKEIVWRSHDPYQPGLIIRSDDPKRVEKLLKDYDKRFATF